MTFSLPMVLALFSYILFPLFPLQGAHSAKENKIKRKRSKRTIGAREGKRIEMSWETRSFLFLSRFSLHFVSFPFPIPYGSIFFLSYLFPIFPTFLRAKRLKEKEGKRIETKDCGIMWEKGK